MVNAVANLPDDHPFSKAVRERISRPNTSDNDKEFDKLQDLYEKYQATFLVRDIKDYEQLKRSENPYIEGMSHAVVLKAIISLLKDDRNYLNGKQFIVEDIIYPAIEAYNDDVIFHEDDIEELKTIVLEISRLIRDLSKKEVTQKVLRLSYNFRILEYTAHTLLNVGVQLKHFRDFLCTLIKDYECSLLIAKNFIKFKYTNLLEFISKLPI